MQERAVANSAVVAIAKEKKGCGQGDFYSESFVSLGSRKEGSRDR